MNKKLNNFKQGVIDKLDELLPDRDRNYDDLFWRNVHEEDFKNRDNETAYECGQEKAEQSTGHQKGLDID